MNIRLLSLELVFKRGSENIEFADFSYYYGEMGAGKSSIARLVDYCLGASLELTPALQSEFTSATLNLRVEDTELALTRTRDEKTTVRARWTRDGAFDVVLPIKNAAGPVVPGTDVEVLSDLVFHLASVHPPRVRKSKLDEDSNLERLSLRDLWAFCYLDQDSMDSSFFHLDSDASPFRRLKSRDVFRYVVGFHHQRVAELEAELEEARSERTSLEAGAEALLKALERAQVGTEIDIERQIANLRTEATGTGTEILAARELQGQPPHAIESLRDRARQVGTELESNLVAINDLEKSVAEARSHLNELEMLATKAKRAATAETLLGTVEFARCPRCAQDLPSRAAGCCMLCGQEEPPAPTAYDVVDADIKARSNELEDLIARRAQQMRNLSRRVTDLKTEKARIDREINEASRTYDSAYLSQALMLERRRAAIEEHIARLQHLKALPQQVDAQRQQADAVRTKEEQIKRELGTARAAAERDNKNLRALERLFVDCLVEAELPGFEPGDDVTISPSDFLPVFHPGGAAGVVTTTFENLGSGGKKTLFKCCFAIAFHRLARQIDAPLPSLLILDSPMKNISERENKAQFEGFHRMLYRLAGSELQGTQFIVIDKELFAPASTDTFTFAERHMRPDDGPLIPYYRGQ